MILPTSESHTRDLLVQMREDLANSTALDQIMPLRNQAQMVRRSVYEARWDFEFLRQAEELNLRAERKMGWILRGLLRRGGDHRSTHQGVDSLLKRYGIRRIDSHRWQLEAKLSEEDLAAYLSHAWRRGQKATTNGLIEWPRTCSERGEPAGDSPDSLRRVAEGLRILSRQPKRFACLYVDPPLAAVRRGRERGFPIDPRLAQLPVAAVAAPQAHLYLKVALPSPRDGVEIVKTWGFEPKAALLRKKRSLDPNDDLQLPHDMWLLAVRDGPGCRHLELPPWVEEPGVLIIDSGEEVHRCVQRVSPPLYLDLFGPRPYSKEWTTVVRQGA